ncbi:hypothetical protein [Halosimplex amylolyticum]|uniref:hypothetical protein n=1 Tax=Halosimplex amylolyticum TaxID=3396616 RepID=UPI003F57F1A5
MSESLTNMGSQNVDATEEQNVTGQMTPILTLSPIDGLKLILEQRADGESGIPMYAELKDSNGDDLPLDTELVLRWDAPGKTQPEVVSEKLENIRPWRTLSLTEQQNTDYEDQTRIDLNGRRLEVLDIQNFEVAIRSSEQISWPNSRIEFARQHVDTRSKN